MWVPEQYNKFNALRHRPALDLITRIPNNSFKSIIDLGCGDGQITQLLSEKYNPQSIVGLDSSDTMLANAKLLDSTIDWQLGDIGNFNGNYDLIFSNAALQWLDNHHLLFSKILSKTSSTIAIQMPNNFAAPSHVLLRETVLENPLFKEKLASTLRVEPVLSKDDYYKILYKDVQYLDIWETQYLQCLNGENAVLEWVRATTLVPIRAKLSNDEYQQFENCYNQKLLSAYPMLENGVTLFPFNRIFIVAVK